MSQYLCSPGKHLSFTQNPQERISLAKPRNLFPNLLLIAFYSNCFPFSTPISFPWMNRQTEKKSRYKLHRQLFFSYNTTHLITSSYIIFSITTLSHAYIFSISIFFSLEHHLQNLSFPSDRLFSKMFFFSLVPFTFLSAAVHHKLIILNLPQQFPICFDLPSCHFT